MCIQETPYQPRFTSYCVRLCYLYKYFARLFYVCVTKACRWASLLLLILVTKHLTPSAVLMYSVVLLVNYKNSF